MSAAERAEADIAEADRKIRLARAAAKRARRAVGRPNRAMADVVVQWRDNDGEWHRGFTAKLSIPTPTSSAIDVLVDTLLVAFREVGRHYEVQAAAITESDKEEAPGEEGRRHLVTYGSIGPTVRPR
jgi:hypothetical protein